MKKILIIGGHGAMGKMIEKFLTPTQQCNITLFGEDDWQNNTHLLAEQDLVIISVPIHATLETIERTAKLIAPTTILADFTSIKQAPLKAMMSVYAGPVLGLHPIFGPAISNPTNQVIACCDGRMSDQYQWFLDLLIELNFHLEKMTPEQHDEKMSFVQGVEHFSVFCLGRFLNQKDIKIDQLLKLASPVYKMELNIVGRLFSQSPELYADIIMSDEDRIDLVGEYVDLINKEYQALKDKKRDGFIESFSETSKWMGDFAPKAYTESNAFLTKQK
tara:strand:+ start:365 stop:1189 length:825 start_codon:yes stop_codon:yes gene_type:complete